MLKVLSTFLRIVLLATFRPKVWPSFGSVLLIDSSRNLDELSEFPLEMLTQCLRCQNDILFGETHAEHYVQIGITDWQSATSTHHIAEPQMSRFIALPLRPISASLQIDPKETY